MNVTELEKCIELYGKDIYAFCRQLTYSRQEAEELYQDTFLKAMELLYKINATENPKSYLLSIALRVWKNHRKKYACRKRIVDMDSLSEEMQDAEEAASYSLEEEMIAKERASEVQKAVYLYYMEGLPLQEIASVLKIPKGTVKSRLYQARESLRNMLEVD